MTMLNAAVIGLGVGEQHALAYANHPHCRLALLCDLSPEKLQEVGARFPGVARTERAEDALRDPAIDVVSIASFDDAHFEQVMLALEAGKHIFVEKPLCRTVEELTAIRQCWQEKPTLRLASNLVLRAAPLYRWLRQSIRDGLFGEIYAFDGDYLYGRLHKITEGWRKDVDHYSVLQGGGIHLIDLMLWLTGQQPSKVSAVGNRISTAGTVFRYNDFATATFQFPSGMIGRITANFGSVHQHQHVMRIFGTKATFLYDDQGPRWYNSREPGSLPNRPTESPLPAAKGALIPDFVEAVLSGSGSTLDTPHEFAIIAACLAADRAIESGRNEEINYS